jgi:nucleotide-binding universal stress UspA family protein
MTAETFTRPVLVGIDGTPSGLEALSLGSALAVAAGAPLVLGAVYGYESSASRFGGPVWPPYDEAVQWLDAAADQLGDAIPWRSVTTCASSIAHGLSRLAQWEEAALLVLGASRRGPVGRWLVGSGAGRVVHGAPCAVAVVPHGWRIRPSEASLAFGAAVSDSPESHEALALAARLAEAPQARLRVLASCEEVAREAVDAVPSAEVAVLDGDPVRRLVEESSELDLLVVGSRRNGPLRSTLLGSVSSGVVEHAHCPVLIVPRGVHAAPEAEPDAACAPA